MEYTSNGIIVDGTEVSLEEITKQVNLVKVKEQDLMFVSFFWDGGRGWDGADEEFVLPKTKAERIVEMMVGCQIYFGEIAGKQSEIYGDLEEDDVMTSTDPDKITQFLKDNPSGHAYNHSFVHTFADCLSDDEEKRVEFNELIKDLI